MSKRRVVAGVGIGVSLLALAYVAHVWPVAKAHAESKTCAGAVASICLSARCWALDHDGIMPTDFLCMSNELCTPKILSCVVSRRVRSSNWSAFSMTNCTYKIVAPGMRIEETNKVYLRCAVHGHLGYGDTTVFDGTRRHGKFD